MKHFFSLSAMCALCLSLMSPQSNAQWARANGPFGGALSCLASVGNNVFAGGRDGGGIFVTTDFGGSWKHADSGLPYTSVNALAASGTNLLAGTDKGIYFASSTAVNWVSVGYNGVAFHALLVTTSSTGSPVIFAGGSGPLPVYLSTNNGAFWRSATNTGLSSTNVYALANGPTAAGSTALYAGTGSGVFYSTNDAASWTAFNTGLSGAVMSLVLGPDSASQTTLFAGSNMSGVYRLSQDKSRWIPASTGLSNLSVYSLTVAGSALYAGTNAGIFVTINGGRSWSASGPTQVTNRVNALLTASTGSSVNLVAGTEWGIFLSADNGATWSQKNSGLNLSVVYAYANTGKGLLAGTYSGGVFLSTDEGITWTESSNGLANKIVDAFAVVGSGSGTTVLAGTAGGVFASTNNGAIWSATNTGLTNLIVTALLPVSATGGSGTNLFAGTMGGVFLSTNNGATWSAVNSGLTSLSVMCLAAYENRLFAGTYDGGVFLSTDNGKSWNPVSIGLPNRPINVLVTIAPTTGGINLFAATEGDGVYRSTNNGTTWSAAGLATQTVWALAVSGQTLLAGDNFGVWYTTDNGVNWRLASTGLTNVNVISFGIAGSSIVAGTNGSGTFRRGLYGMIPYPQTWFAQTSPLGKEALGQIRFVSSTEGWVVAASGKLLHTTNAGSTWSAVSPGGIDSVAFNTDNLGSLTPLSFISSSTGWVIGSSGSMQFAHGALLFKTTDGGTSWTKRELTGWNTAFGVQFVDATHGWAEVVNGTSSNFTFTVLRTTDGGNQWNAVSSSSTALCFPRFIDASNGWAILGSMGGSSSIARTTDGGSTWSTQYSDNTPGGLNRIQFADANTGWVVGDSAKIFKTTNGGTTWTRLTNAAIDHSTRLKALFFLNGNVGWAAGQVASGQIPSYVIHTTDGGTSWSVQGGATWAPPNQSPVQSSIIGLYFVDANTGWMTTYYGDLVRTTSGGEITAVPRVDHPMIATRYQLDQNYPNPFNPSTTIRYELPQAGNVSLRIYNTLGQIVTTLVDETKGAGVYQAHWNAAGVSSGLYIYRLLAGEYAATGKMLLLK